MIALGLNLKGLASGNRVAAFLDRLTVRCLKYPLKSNSFRSEGSISPVSEDIARHTHIRQEVKVLLRREKSSLQFPGFSEQVPRLLPCHGNGTVGEHPNPTDPHPSVLLGGSRPTSSLARDVGNQRVAEVCVQQGVKILHGLEVSFVQLPVADELGSGELDEPEAPVAELVPGPLFQLLLLEPVPQVGEKTLKLRQNALLRTDKS